MTETDIQRRIMLALSTEHGRIWRNNVGNAWQGKVVSQSPTRIVLEHYRAIQFGLGPGSSDLIGPTSIEITPKMVGRRIAVFTALEIKRPKKLLTEEQQRFIDVIVELGGIADVASSVDQAVSIVDGFTSRLLT